MLLPRGSGHTGDRCAARAAWGDVTGISGGEQSTFRYDAFERMTCATRTYSSTGACAAGGTGQGMTFTYDALDRRDTRNSGSVTTQLSYIGTGELVSDADGSDGTRRSYDYTSDFERLAMHEDQGGSVTPASYIKDANGSVQNLATGSDGKSLRAARTSTTRRPASR